ncbi:MAG TPA: Ig-like domain-containing protein, partial [Terriglobales bacterium]|nr:Ig-like domain-containing protein [Terriglobales bacterium]
MKIDVSSNRILYGILGVMLLAAVWLGPAVLTGNASPAPAPQGAGISVAITPPAVGLTLSRSVTLTATVTNDSTGKGVTWAVSGTSCSGSACGTLTSASAFSVTYTAPNVAGVYTVTATSVAD